MPQNPTLPPKWPRSGVTFHSFEIFKKSENRVIFSRKKAIVEMP